LNDSTHEHEDKKGDKTSADLVSLGEEQEIDIVEQPSGQIFGESELDQLNQKEGNKRREGDVSRSPLQKEKARREIGD